MFSMKRICISLSKATFNRRFNSNFKNPFKRTWNLISEEVKSGFVKKPFKNPEHADVVIIGGGYIGLSVAYWLKTRAGDGLSIVVLDKAPGIVNYQNTHSHSIISQHFSLPENMFMSQYSAEFLRNISDHFKENIDIKFTPYGSLLLASEKYADKLEHNVTLQKEYGIKNVLLTVEEIQKRFPWINTSDIKLGCISAETEGVFDTQALFNALIKKVEEQGTIYLNAEVTNFEMDVQRDVLMEGVSPGTYKKINRLIYKTENNEEISIKFAACVIAAGAESSNVAKLAKIGTGDGLLMISLPIEKREYKVYSIENEENKMSVGLGCPIVMDTSGLWLRRNGLQSNFISGQIPSLRGDSTFSDEEIFYSSLHNRFPNCENMKANIIGTEYIDCNTYDDTGIIGPHPYHTNLFIAAGFGRNGVYHSPAIGKAIAELIIDCQYTTIDLTRFGFDRLLINEPLIEINVY